MGKLKTLALPIGISVVVAAIITVLVMTFAGKDEDVYRIIKVNRFEGTVTVDRGEKMSAFEGLRLVSEDSVTVGADSFLELLADSDKHIGAEENTAFTVQFEGTETNGGITINLLYGRQLFTIDNKLSETSYFEVTTPNATMSVCGTEFWVEYIPEKETTIVEVIEGIVEVDYYGVKEFLKPGDKRVIYPEYAENSDADNSLGTITTTVSEETTTTTTEETTVSETTVTGEDAPAVTTVPYEMIVPEATTVSADVTVPEETTSITTVPEETTSVTTVPEETTEVTTVPRETTVPAETTTTSSSSGTSSPTTTTTTTAETTLSVETTTTSPSDPSRNAPYYYVGNLQVNHNATTYEYDGNGKVTKANIYDTDGNFICYNTYEYDESSGNIRIKVYNADGILNSEHILDSDFNDISEIGYKADGENIDYIRDYDENGNMERWTYYQDDGSHDVLEYNDDNKEIKHTYYDADNNYQGHSETEYDENGNKTKYTVWNADGEITDITEYYSDGTTKKTEKTRYADGTIGYSEYDESGKRTKHITYDSDGITVKYYTEYEYYSDGTRKKDSLYNADGRLSSEVYYAADGSYDHEVRYAYNPDGSYIVSEYDSNGDLKKVTKYDDDGNVIEETTY